MSHEGRAIPSSIIFTNIDVLAILSKKSTGKEVFAQISIDHISWTGRTAKSTLFFEDDSDEDDQSLESDEHDGPYRHWAMFETTVSGDSSCPFPICIDVSNSEVFDLLLSTHGGGSNIVFQLLEKGSRNVLLHRVYRLVIEPPRYIFSDIAEDEDTVEEGGEVEEEEQVIGGQGQHDESSQTNFVHKAKLLPIESNEKPMGSFDVRLKSKYTPHAIELLQQEAKLAEEKAKAVALAARERKKIEAQKKKLLRGNSSFMDKQASFSFEKPSSFGNDEDKVDEIEDADRVIIKEVKDKLPRFGCVDEFELSSSGVSVYGRIGIDRKGKIFGGGRDIERVVRSKSSSNKLSLINLMINEHERHSHQPERNETIIASFSVVSNHNDVGLADVADLLRRSLRITIEGFLSENSYLFIMASNHTHSDGLLYDEEDDVPLTLPPIKRVNIWKEKTTKERVDRPKGGWVGVEADPMDEEEDDEEEQSEDNDFCDCAIIAAKSGEKANDPTMTSAFHTKALPYIFFVENVSYKEYTRFDVCLSVPRGESSEIFKIKAKMKDGRSTKVKTTEQQLHAPLAFPLYFSNGYISRLHKRSFPRSLRDLRCIPSMGFTAEQYLQRQFHAFIRYHRRKETFIRDNHGADQAAAYYRRVQSLSCSHCYRRSTSYVKDDDGETTEAENETSAPLFFCLGDSTDPSISYQVCCETKADDNSACALALLSNFNSHSQSDALVKGIIDKEGEESFKDKVIFDRFMELRGLERWKKRQMDRKDFEKIRWRSSDKIRKIKAKHSETLFLFNEKMTTPPSLKWTKKVKTSFLQRMSDFSSRKESNRQRLVELYKEKMEPRPFQFVPPSKLPTKTSFPSNDPYLKQSHEYRQYDQHQRNSPLLHYAKSWDVKLSSPSLSFRANHNGIFSIATFPVPAIDDELASLPLSALCVANLDQQSHDHRNQPIYTSLIFVESLPPRTSQEKGVQGLALTFGVALVPKDEDDYCHMQSLSECGFGLVTGFFTFGVVISETVELLQSSRRSLSGSIFCSGEEQGTLPRNFEVGDAAAISVNVPDKKVKFSIYSLSSSDECVVSFQSDLPVTCNDANIRIIMGCTLPPNTRVNLLESEDKMIECRQSLLESTSSGDADTLSPEQLEDTMVHVQMPVIINETPAPDIAPHLSLTLSLLPSNEQDSNERDSENTPHNAKHDYEWKSCIASTVTKSGVGGIEPCGLYIDEESFNFCSDDVFAARIETKEGDMASGSWELATVIPRFGCAVAIINNRIVKKSRCQCIFQSDGGLLWRKLSKDSKSGHEYFLPAFCKPAFSDQTFHHFIVRATLGYNLLPGSLKLEVKQKQHSTSSNGAHSSNDFVVPSNRTVHFAVVSGQDSWEIVEISVMDVEFLCWK